MDSPLNFEPKIQAVSTKVCDVHIILYVSTSVFIVNIRLYKHFYIRLWKH